jgi:TaqI-like C-terminal specificity domain
LREKGKWKHDRWYAFGRSQNLSEMEQTKILTPSIANAASYTLDKNDYYYFVGSGGGSGYGITLKEINPVSYEYLLGLLNSKLLDSYLQSYSSTFRGRYFAYNRQYIEKLPIYVPDPSDKSKYKYCTKIEEYVKKIIEFKKDSKRNSDAEFLENKIDELVHKIYCE